ncbi:toll/interleukin-1 receptor domain-containing protein [Salmonella enterica]|nr:toll/interleukin-1 receptor domain-containing protein [Salmonella enterica]EIY1235453.1 toll/interleukin-1 receptor domain-containing protein [Salmonella enterica]
MKDEEDNLSVFISYAWGGALEKKEWIRQHIVESLKWKYPVFWDRDSIGFGESIDACISKALDQRPLMVFCICDTDYLVSAQKVGSGLYRELQLLTKIATLEGVKIIPLIFDTECAQNLPEPLDGRTYLNLEEMHHRGLYLGDAMLALADGRTQSWMTMWLKKRIARDDLHRYASSYFQMQQLSIWRNASTHEVTIRPGELLLAPQWMWDSNEWNYMLSDENATFCPLKGRWHWDYFTPSRGMRALGTAVMSAFFPQCTTQVERAALQNAGVVLAQKVFAMTYMTESFILEYKEIISILLNDSNGYKAIELLLESTRRLK